MRKRRIRRNFGDAQGLTPADREAMRTYRANRGSKRYYEDLDVIGTGPKTPSTNNDEKK